jgi:hypothetical protein
MVQRSLKCLVALVVGGGLAAAVSGLASGAAPAQAVAAGAVLTTTVHPSADCTIYSGAPADSSRCGKGSDDTIGDDGNSFLYRTMLSFGDLGLPAGSAVHSATLTLNVLGAFGQTTTWVFQLTRSFTPGAATWDSYDGIHPWTTPGGDFNDSLQATEAVSAAGAVQFQVTSMVQSWIDGTAAPETMLLPYAPKDNAYTFSRTGADAPSLTITYVPPGTTTVTTTVTQTTPKPTRVGGSRSHHALSVHLVFGWTWVNADVRLRKITIGRLPAHVTVSLTCRSGCSKRTTHATGASAARRLLLSLRRRRYRPGDVLLITLAAPGRRAERVQVVIRRERVPLTRLL